MLPSPFGTVISWRYTKSSTKADLFFGISVLISACCQYYWWYKSQNRDIKIEIKHFYWRATVLLFQEISCAKTFISIIMFANICLTFRVQTDIISHRAWKLNYLPEMYVSQKTLSTHLGYVCVLWALFDRRNFWNPTTKGSSHKPKVWRVCAYMYIYPSFRVFCSINLCNTYCVLHCSL